MEIKTVDLNKGKNVSLTAYIQPVEGEFATIKKRPVILILPGGGYFACSDQEADPVAFPYLEAGYHVCILRYSVGKYATWPNPLEDYESAALYIRSKEEEWHLYPDKLAVVGFSAGGHLAACAASMSENRPNAAVLGYPVITRETVSGYLPSAPDAAEAVNEDTCPCFIFAGRNDTTVPVQNSVEMMLALMKYDITYESHIYAYGRHGFSTCSSVRGFGKDDWCSRTPDWVNDSIEWLRDVFGDFENSKMTEPRCNKFINGNHSSYYSIECTISHAMNNSSVFNILKPYFQSLFEAFHIEEIPDVMRSFYVKELLQLCQISEDTIKKIDVKLRQIPNEK